MCVICRQDGITLACYSFIWKKLQDSKLCSTFADVPKLTEAISARFLHTI